MAIIFVVVLAGFLALWGFLFIASYSETVESQFALLCGCGLAFLLTVWFLGYLVIRFSRIQLIDPVIHPLRSRLVHRLRSFYWSCVAPFQWLLLSLWHRERHQWLRDMQLPESERPHDLATRVARYLIVFELIVLVVLVMNFSVGLVVRLWTSKISQDAWGTFGVGAFLFMTSVVLLGGAFLLNRLILVPTLEYGSRPHRWPHVTFVVVLAILLVMTAYGGGFQSFAAIGPIFASIGGWISAIPGFLLERFESLWLPILLVCFALAVAQPIVVIVRRRPKYILESVRFLHIDEREERRSSSRRLRGAQGAGSSFVDPREMQLVAEELTTQLSTQLQRISGLLASRQEETLSPAFGTLQSGPDGRLTLFVTSGLEDPLFSQLDTISDAEISGVRLPRLGTLLNLFLRITAVLYIKARVYAGSHGNVEVRLEISSRAIRATTVLTSSFLVGHSDSTQIMENVSQVAEELALKTTLFLGGRHDLASSWQSLRLFVTALEASRQRNWWLAIANYQQATSMEEGTRGAHPIGQYHIGATLLLQGQPRLALDHLLKAAAVGPVRAETYYMLALTLLTLQHERPADSEFSMIVRYLHDAIGARGDFGEAKHLLGLVYYQRWKTSQPTRSYLTQAEFVLADAYRTYELQIARGIQQQRWNFPGVLGDTKRVQAYMTVAHNWADTLRSLGSYARARLLYEDTAVFFPSSSRNLADELRTLNLAKKWTEARDLVERDIASYPAVYWSAPIQLYYGVTLAKLGRGVARVADRSLPPGFAELDFALYLRPRYVVQNEQTRWLESWLAPFASDEREIKQWKRISSVVKAGQSVEASAHEEDINLLEVLLQSPLEASGDNKRASIIWLSLRFSAQLFLFKKSRPAAEDTLEEDVLLDNARIVEKYFASLSSVVPVDQDLHAHWTAYQKLQEIRERSAHVLYGADLRKSQRDAEIFVDRTHRFLELYTEWSTIDAIWKERLTRHDARTDPPADTFFDRNNLPTLARRWEIDVYMQVALMLCRQLAATKNYFFLSKIADNAWSLSMTWIRSWGKLFSTESPPFRFSSPVLRYQMISAHSWRAMAQLYSESGAEIISTQATNRSTSHQVMRERLARLKGVQQVAIQYRLPLHPFSLFVQAEHYKACGMYHDALDRYTLVLDASSEFEGDQFNPFEYAVSAPFEEVSQPEQTLKDNDPLQHYYLERVAGQQQFGFFINPARVYAELADTVEQVGDLASSVQYLFKALSASAYADSDLQYFIRLAEQLIKSDAFEAALATVNEARSRLVDYPQDAIRTSSMITLDVLECVLLARLSRYDQAMRRSDMLAGNGADISAMAVASSPTQQGAALAGEDSDVQKGPVVVQVINPNLVTLVEKYLSAITPAEPLDWQVWSSKLDEKVEGLTRASHVNWEGIRALFSSLMAKLYIGEEGQKRVAPLSLKSLSARELLNSDDYKPFRTALDRAALHIQSNDSSSFQSIAKREAIGLKRDGAQPSGASSARDSAECEAKGPELADMPTAIEARVAAESSVLGFFIERVNRGAFVMLFQMCELYNNRAYSRAALEQDLDIALAQSMAAIAVMSDLRAAAASVRNALVGLNGMPDASSPERLDERLAQYYDTLAWVLFRRREVGTDTVTSMASDDLVIGKMSDLHLAAKVLEQLSLEHSESLAVPHYHLSQVNMALVEESWQDRRLRLAQAFDGDLRMLRNWLHQASLHWQHAKSLDKTGRIEPELRYLNKRIERMIVQWREYTEDISLHVTRASTRSSNEKLSHLGEDR